MPVRTRRWNDPREADDGYRLLVCRIRPRGVAKARETWDAWWLEEMATPAAAWRIRGVAAGVAAGETLTLLCSSACTDPARCHRTLLGHLLVVRR